MSVSVALERLLIGRPMASNLASPGAVSTELQRLAHYREQAAKFRKWAENETAPETGDGLRDVARQYECWRVRIRSAASLMSRHAPQPKVRQSRRPTRLARDRANDGLGRCSTLARSSARPAPTHWSDAPGTQQ